MTIATVDDIKIKLGQETLTAFEESQVQFYLDSTEGLLNSMFGDFSLSNKTEKLSLCDVKDGAFYVENPNPLTIVSIDGTAYTGVLDTDYMVDGKKIIVNDLGTYLNGNFHYFTIVYNSGYDPLPSDLVYFHTLLVEGELVKEGGKDIASEKLGPRMVSFINTPQNRSTFEAIKSKYIIITI